MTEYTLIQNSIITDVNLSNGAFRVLSFLTSMCFGDKTQCYPSQKYIGEQLHISVRTVGRHISELIEAKIYLTKKRRGSISDVYTILTKVVAQKTEGIIKEMKQKFNAKNKFEKSSKADSNNWNNTGSERTYNLTELENNLLGYNNQTTTEEVQLE